MTVATFAKLASELGYDLSALPTPPAELGELIEAWERLPLETQTHLTLIIDSVLSAHGLKKGNNGSGASCQTPAQAKTG